MVFLKIWFDLELGLEREGFGLMAKSPGPKPGVSRQTSGRKQSICSPGLARQTSDRSYKAPPADASPGGDAVTTRHLKDMVKRELAASRTEIAALVRAVVARELDAQNSDAGPLSPAARPRVVAS